MKEAPAAMVRILASVGVALLAAPSTAARRRPDDPFGDLMPPEERNPVILGTGLESQRLREEATRILTGLSVINEQTELEETARLEVLCARGPKGYGVVTHFEVDREEAVVEQQDAGHSQPVAALRACEQFHQLKKSIPAEFFTDVEGDGGVAPPAFPESLGEFVVEAVQRAKGGSEVREHVVLELAGCSSCENDFTETVEWGGLAPLDEAGGYRKMYTRRAGMYWDRFWKAHVRRGHRQPIVASPAGSAAALPRAFSVGSTPSSAQKYVKLPKRKYVSTYYDKNIAPKVRRLAGVAELRSHFDPEFASQKWDDTQDILDQVRKQARHVPFNHRLEQLHLHLYVCRERAAEAGEAAELECPQKPTETMVVHDGALTTSSSEAVFLDELGRSGRCAFGPCSGRAVGEQGLLLNGVLHPFDACSNCSSGWACAASRVSPDRRSQGLAAEGEGGQGGWFNCLVDRTYGPEGPSDRLLQALDDTDPAARKGSGLLFAGTQTMARVVGHINWHVTALGKGHCQPIMQDAAFIGLGVDEADACRGHGGVDVDVGAVLLKCTLGARGSGLGHPTEERRCYPVKQLHHRKYGAAAKDHPEYRDLAAISPDDRSGLGDGDDEWLYLRLGELASMGLTHIVLTANIYGCGDGSVPPPLSWGGLEGAFLRLAGSSGKAAELPAAKTTSYIDLDQMRVGAERGAVVALLYLSDEDALAKPEAMSRSDTLAAKGKVWKVASLQMPIAERSVTDVVKHVSHLINSLHELELSEQVGAMDLDMALTTGQALPGLAKLRELVGRARQHGNATRADTDYARAQAMKDEDFWKHVANVLPGGLPSADAQCVSA